MLKVGLLTQIRFEPIRLQIAIPLVISLFKQYLWKELLPDII